MQDSLEKVDSYIQIRYRFTNERHSQTINFPMLARSLLTLIDSCRIYYVFKIKSGHISKALCQGKKSNCHQYSLKHCSTQTCKSRIKHLCCNLVESILKNVGNYLLCGIKLQPEELNLIRLFEKPLGSDCSLIKGKVRSCNRNIHDRNLNRKLYFNP